VTFRHSRDVHPWRAMLHRTLRRHRTRWILTTLLAFFAVVWTVTAVSDAERESRAWGDRRIVAVARHDLLPGEVITDDAIEWAPRPTIMLTDDVAADAVGRTVTHAVAAGEVVIERRLSGGTATGPGALLEPDALAFAVPVDTSTPTLSVGDLVDAFAPAEPVGSSTSRSAAAIATRIARRATVVSVSEIRIMIAVDAVQAPAVARALLDTSVVLALSG
jgi:Flp pilus assembly protein CpaB